MSESVQRLQHGVGRAMRRIESLLGDLDALQDDLGRVLPSLSELAVAEHVEAISALLGFDADLPHKLREATAGLAALLEKLDDPGAAEAWLRRLLDELK